MTLCYNFLILKHNNLTIFIKIIVEYLQKPYDRAQNENIFKLFDPPRFGKIIKDTLLKQQISS